MSSDRSQTELEELKWFLRHYWQAVSFRNAALQRGVKEPTTALRVFKGVVFQVNIGSVIPGSYKHGFYDTHPTYHVTNTTPLWMILLVFLQETYDKQTAKKQNTRQALLAHRRR